MQEKRWRCWCCPFLDSRCRVNVYGSLIVYMCSSVKILCFCEVVDRSVVRQRVVVFVVVSPCRDGGFI